MGKKSLLLLGCALTIYVVRGQVINIENRRLHTDSVRKAGDINVAFLLNSTNGNNIMTFRGNALVQLKSRDYKHLWLGLANYDFAKAAKDNFVNAFFIHLRYNFRISSLIRWEAFVQSQRNLPLGIRFRNIVGTGPRFKVGLGKNAEFYLGTSVMFEHERTAPPDDKISTDLRSSNYVSLNIRFPKINGSFTSTSYFQPLYRDFSDHRIMNDSRFSFRITEKLQVYTNFSYFYDARPPVGIRKSTLNLEQGFGMRL
jgi:hypothetical protein